MNPLQQVSRILFKAMFFLLLWAFPLAAQAAGGHTYTVKSGGGGDYTTISACAAAAVAGDTCLIYAGSYSGWTQGKSGTAGSPITFTANAGDTVTVTSGINLSGISYVTISYLALQGTIQQFDGAVGEDCEIRRRGRAALRPRSCRSADRHRIPCCNRATRRT